MIIVGIKDCKFCEHIKTILDNFEYIELGDNTHSSSDPRIYSIKKIIGKLDDDILFPIIFKNDLSEVISYDQVSDHGKEFDLDLLIKKLKEGRYYQLPSD